jgi:hypothetical protein
MASTDTASPITRLIDQAQADDKAVALSARGRLFPLVEPILRRLARARLRGRFGATFQTTMLADQAFLDLLNNESRRFGSRAEFFRIASAHMWQLLARHARRRRPDNCSPEQAEAQPAPSTDAGRRLFADELFLRLHAALVELEASASTAS